MKELEERRSIDTITAEIQFYKRQAGVSILEIGKRLTEAKEQLNHGQWLDWLEREVEVSASMAQKMMQVAREYANTESIPYLGVTKALALLSVPAEEREQFAQEVGAEQLSVRELKEAIRQRDETIRQREAERDTARQELNSRQRELTAQIEYAGKLKQDKQEALAKISELENRPPETVTVDASEAQIAAAEQRGRERAQYELDTAKRQLSEQVQNVTRLEDRLASQRQELERLRLASEEVGENAKINQALGEINGRLREMQQANQRTTELLGNLDELSRQRVQDVRRRLLRRMLENIQ